MSDKKLYQLSTYTEADWEYVHNILTADGSLDDNIPAERIECADLKEHSPTRAVYLLTEDEAKQLSKCPQVRAISLDFASYPDQFKAPPEELYNTKRYSTPTKHYRNFADTNTLPGSPDVTDLNRSGYQLLRCAQKEDPWYGISDTTVINDQIDYSGDGTDVDVIVGDDGCWFGHVEFQSDATGSGPANYRGGNVLPGGGTCDLLDLVLDAPYYIDPDWFEAVPGRLMTRWDGTVVPVETVARNWWEFPGQRSSQFAAFGSVMITSAYTRDFNNGDNFNISSVGQHGTCCAALTYGRTQGWAFNANKWFIQVYNTNGSDIEQYFDIMKIFHLYKPINPTHGDRNPTISSNSWGYRATPPSTGFYYYQGDTTGVSYGVGTKPGFMKWVGYWGDGGRMKGEMIDNAYTIAGEEMINSGVIFVGAAGNSGQKQVGPTHPDFDNYYNSGSNQAVTDNNWFEFGIPVLPYTNRRGFPQHLGKTPAYEYPVINIGALDDAYQVDGKERKVNYSDMGPEIDCYAPADGTMAANHSYGVEGYRADTYPGAGFDAGTGVTGVFGPFGFLSGGLDLFSDANSSYNIETDINSAVVTSIANSLLGGAGLTADTTVSNGNNDDGYWQITLPFTVTFNANDYTDVYIGTNTYITFGAGSTEFAGLSGINPPLPKIMLSADDNSAQRIYHGVEGTAPNRTYRIRYEGTNRTTGTLGSPNMVYEIVFYENAPTSIDFHVGVNANGPSPTVFSDAKFSGTSAACPVATGLIATVLQNNRSWGWADVRNWLRSRVEVQDPAKFHYGVDSLTANASSWDDVNSLEGSDARVIYNSELLPAAEARMRGLSLKGGLKLNFRN